ncbi:MAG: RND transporter, partial [Moraxellaceae bacterium]
MKNLRQFALTSLIASSMMYPLLAQAASIAKADPQLPQSAINRIQTLMDNPATWKKIPKHVTLCVFSPDGAQGDNFKQAMSYLTEVPKYTKMARDIGINLNITMLNPLTLRIDIAYPKLKKTASTETRIRVYSDERVLAEDFKMKKCDGAGMSNIRARQFNSFMGSMD